MPNHMNSSEDRLCELCGAVDFRYTCPKCNVRYCSVVCYKSPSHLKCSEEFYKNCIQEELTSTEPRSKEDMKKIYDILKRIRETDAGIEGIDFADPLDSDDDDPNQEEYVCTEGEEEEELATRLQGVNLNDAEEVWNRLNEAERLEFQKMIDCGDIIKLIPDFEPWWVEPKASKIVELDSKTEAHNKKKLPQKAKNIPKYSDLCKKQPSPCVHYNLWNIVTAYSCIVRFFGGDHLSSPDEAVAHFINLSATLKYGTNFEDTEDAILSVETEALTTGNGTTVGGLYVESREQLKQDARQLMSTTNAKLLALSDILNILQLAKVPTKDSKKEKNDFQKLFAVCNGSVELSRSKIKQILKKIEFFLAYVNRECAIISVDISDNKGVNFLSKEMI